MRSSDDKPTAILVDDHPTVLAAVNDILRKDCEILATVNDGGKAVDAIHTFKPDIVVLDIAMPRMNGLEVVQYLRHAGLHPGVVFLTVTEDPDYARAARKLDASYVVKRRMHTDLVIAVKETLAGRLFPSMTATDKAPSS